MCQGRRGKGGRLGEPCETTSNEALGADKKAVAVGGRRSATLEVGGRGQQSSALIELRVIRLRRHWVITLRCQEAALSFVVKG